MRHSLIVAFQLALLLGFAAAAAAALPPLRIDAPATMLPVARQIEQLPGASLEIVNQLIGAPPGGEPIDILLAPEDSALAARTPEYVNGYAIGETSDIVLFPARASTYPDDGLPNLLRHEIAHILIHRASGGRPVPRWFHEGLAMTAGGSWDLEDRTRLTLGMMNLDDLDLATVERGFAGSEFQVHRSYAISTAFTRHILNELGADAPKRILEKVAEGLPFDEAFLDATGRALPLVERDFWRSTKIWNRWIPFVTSSITLWTAITLLALWAIRRRRRRDARIRELWELEEQRIALYDSSVVEHPKRDEWVH